MNGEHRSIRISTTPGGAAGEPDSPPTLQAPASAASPAIDIHEGPEGLILEADLPGVADSSLRVELEQNILHLHARVARPVPEGARVLHEETRTVEYYRSFILSDEVQRDQIRAELRDGVLRLTLPRADRARARRIEVRTS